MDQNTRNQALHMRARNASLVVETQIRQPWPFTGGRWDQDEQVTFDGSESNAFDADIFTGFVPKTLSLQLIPGGPVTVRTLAWPARFQPVHLNLIPRGPNRGKVMAWCGDVAFGTLGGAWRTGEEWSFQPWSIIDPNAGTPMTAQHFLLPLGPRDREGPTFVTANVGAQRFDAVAHGFETGDRVCVSTTPGDTMPAPFTIDTNYYVVVIDPDKFTLQSQVPDASGVLQTTGVNVVMVTAGTGTVRVTKDYVDTLFCAGHAWNEHGMLVVAGGTRYQISHQWRHSVYAHTWVWDPTELASLCWTAGGPNPGVVSPDFVNLERVDLGKAAGSPTHYETGYGRWIQGPDLTVARYYPTVVMTAPMTVAHGAYTGKTCALVVGGDNNPSGRDPISQINGTYESLVIDAAPTYTGAGPTSYHGLIKEQVGGAYTWDGPSTWDPVTNPWPEGNPYEDGLFFYPHCHLLTTGKLFVGAFCHRSATLDHDTAPGTWTKTEGHDDRPGLINAFRYYPSSTHVIQDGVDVVLRMGGGQVPVLQIPDLPVHVMSGLSGNEILGSGHKFPLGYPVAVTNTGGALPVNLFVATTYYVIPVSATSLKLAASAADAVAGTAIAISGGSGTTRVCADVDTPFGRSVHALFLGGYRPTAWPDLLLDTRTVDRITPGIAASQWTVGPAMNRARSLQNIVWLADGSQLCVGGVNIDDAVAADVPPAIHPLLAPTPAVGGGHDHQDPDIGETEAGFVYHLTCELLRWRGTRWEALDWASAASRRDYHSTAVLLPDARVLVGGGEGREHDFEVFEPPYLAPSTDHPEVGVTRPTAVALPDNVLTDSTYDVTYGSSVRVTCAALPAGQRIERVTLVTPGSATHHRDWSQQFYDLTVVASSTPNQVNVTMPPNAKHVRPGYAMLFVISSMGVPSEAIWILLP